MHRRHVFADVLPGRHGVGWGPFTGASGEFPDKEFTLLAPWLSYTGLCNCLAGVVGDLFAIQIQSGMHDEPDPHLITEISNRLFGGFADRNGRKHTTGETHGETDCGDLRQKNLSATKL